MAAFWASVVASFAGSAEWGLVGGIAAGVAMGALLAVFAMRYLVNQVVLGVVLIALATGLTDFLLSQIPTDPEIRARLNNPQTLDPMPEPGSRSCPRSPTRCPGCRSSGRRCSTRRCWST